MVVSYSTLRRPVNQQIVDPQTGRIREEWGLYFQQLTKRVNAVTTSVAGGIGFTIDGGGSVLTTGVKGSLRVPISMTLSSAALIADQNGSIEIDIWKDTGANYPPTSDDSITASAPLSLVGSDYEDGIALTDWETSIAAGDVLYFNINSVSHIKRIEINLAGMKT